MDKIIDQLKTSKAARTAYWVTLIFAITIFIIGIFCPPKGVIHGSVLVAAGSVMLFTLGYIALCYKSSVKLDVDIDDKKVSISTNHAEGGDDAGE